MSRSFGIGLILLLASACSHSQPEPAPAPVAAADSTPPPVVVTVRDTVRVRGPEVDQQMARLQMKVLEQDAQIDELQARLDAAQQEVVRRFAGFKNTASRAEAASAMAEAEIATQSPRGAANTDVAQGKRLLQLGKEAFDQENYGGALYLANQVKALVSGRAPGGERSLRPGEKLFASPVRLKATSRCNVREGPGQGFKVLFTLKGGAPLTGHSYTEEWIMVSDDGGRSGWVSRALVGPRK